MFKILREEFEYAIENLNFLMNQKSEHSCNETIKRLGQQLFIYYIWGLYPLTGDKGLLERFYLKTDKHRGYWTQLSSSRLWAYLLLAYS